MGIRPEATLGWLVSLDLFKGPYQNITGGDGSETTPHYPLHSMLRIDTIFMLGIW